MDLTKHQSPSNRTSLIALHHGFREVGKTVITFHDLKFMEDFNNALTPPGVIKGNNLVLSRNSAIREEQMKAIESLLMTTVAQFDSERGHWKFPKL